MRWLFLNKRLSKPTCDLTWHCTLEGGVPLCKIEFQNLQWSGINEKCGGNSSNFFFPISCFQINMIGFFFVCEKHLNHKKFTLHEFIVSKVNMIWGVFCVCTKLSKTFIAADCHSDERAKKDLFFLTGKVNILYIKKEMTKVMCVIWGFTSTTVYTNESFLAGHLNDLMYS